MTKLHVDQEPMNDGTRLMTGVFYWRRNVLGKWMPCRETDPLPKPKTEQRTTPVTLTDEHDNWSLEQLATAYPREDQQCSGSGSSSDT